MYDIDGLTQNYIFFLQLWNFCFQNAENKKLAETEKREKSELEKKAKVGTQDRIINLFLTESNGASWVDGNGLISYSQSSQAYKFNSLAPGRF